MEEFNREAALQGVVKVLEVSMLEDQITKVRALRAIMDTKTKEHAALMAKLMADFARDHKDLIESLGKAHTDCAQGEGLLRKLTLEAYQKTNSKKPAEGVGVRISKSLQYDENSIKQWAIKEGHIMFLALDRAGFDAWAKAKIKTGLPASLAESGAGVIEIETASATIAKDLQA
jgi:hypothetical protein